MKRQVIRLLGSALFGYLCFLFISGLDMGNVSISSAFEQHGWDISSISWSLHNPPRYAFEIRVGAGVGAGLLLLVWNSAWNWMFGDW